MERLGGISTAAHAKFLRPHLLYLKPRRDSRAHIIILQLVQALLGLPTLLKTVYVYILIQSNVDNVTKKMSLEYKIMCGQNGWGARAPGTPPPVPTL